MGMRSGTLRPTGCQVGVRGVAADRDRQKHNGPWRRQAWLPDEPSGGTYLKCLDFSYLFIAALNAVRNCRRSMAGGLVFAGDAMTTILGRLT